MVDNVKVSSIIMSLIGAFLLALINNPNLLETIMQNYYIAYGVLVLTVIGIVYNVVFAGKQEENKEEETQTDEFAA